MKRSWIGLLLLLVLLAGSLIASHVMLTVHSESAEKLEQASRFALDGNWTGAAFATAQAKQQWERYDFLRSALSDHAPGEEIDACFAALRVYGAAAESVSFAALSSQTATMIRAIADAHSLKFHTLL